MKKLSIFLFSLLVILSITIILPLDALFSLPFKKLDYFATTKNTKFYTTLCNGSNILLPAKTNVIYQGESSIKICNNGVKWRKVSIDNKIGYIKDSDLTNINPLYILVNSDNRARVITSGGGLPIRDFSLTGPVIGEFRNGTLVFIESIKPPIKVGGVISYPAEVQDGHYQGIVDMKYLVNFKQ
jgi:hypothetical protein